MEWIERMKRPNAFAMVENWCTLSAHLPLTAFLPRSRVIRILHCNIDVMAIEFFSIAVMASRLSEIMRLEMPKQFLCRVSEPCVESDVLGRESGMLSRRFRWQCEAF
jgi:hypothetical protein